MKTVVITGGSDGLGKALAKALSVGNNVVILARDEIALGKIAQETGCDWRVCDVRDAETVEYVIDEVVAKHGGIDVLINNAGVIINGELSDMSSNDIENVISTNTLGSIYVAKAALKHMKRRKSGLIINVVSQSGLNARANRSIYNASKFALTGFTKALQQETSQYGVRVTGFYPGTIRTGLFAKAGIEMKGPAILVADAVKAVEFVLSLGNDVVIPELGIKHASA